MSCMYHFGSFLTCTIVVKQEFNLRYKKLLHHDNVETDQFSSQDFFARPTYTQENKTQNYSIIYIMLTHVQ